MNIDIDDYVADIRQLVAARKDLWKELDKQNVVSYTWLARFAEGGFRNPRIETLKKVKTAIESARSAA